MRFLARLATLLLLALPGAGAAAHLLDGVELVPGPDACGEGPAGLRLAGEDRLLLQLQPRRRYALLIEEHGIDLRIAVEGEDRRWLNSEPWGYATEPVEVLTDASGQAELRISLHRRTPWARIALRAQCLGTADALTSSVWRARMQLALELARVSSGADGAAALAALRSAAALLWVTDAGSEARLWGLFQLAGLAWSSGMPLPTRAWFESARSVAAARGDELFAAQAELGAARAMMRSGDRATAKARLEAARLLVASLGMLDAAASAENALCVLMDGLGELEAAEQCYLRAYVQFAEIGDQPAQAITLSNRSGVLSRLGRYGEARRELDRSEAVAELIENKGILARVLVMRAQLARWRGDFEEALAQLDRAERVQRESGSIGVHHVNQLVAETYAAADEPVRALHFYARALADAERRGDRARIATTRTATARLWARMGDLDNARELARTATRDTVQTGLVDAIALALLAEAEFAEQAGATNESIAALRRISEAAQQPNWRLQHRVHAMRLRLGDLEASAEAMDTLGAAMAQALQNADFILYLQLAADRMHLLERAADAEAARALAEQTLAHGVRVAAEVRGPALRNSLLSLLKPFATAALWRLPAGELTAEQAMQAISGLEQLRRIDHTPMDDGDRNDALDELERLLGDGFAGIGQATTGRESVMLQLTSVDARTRPERSAPAAAALSGGTAPSLQPGQSLLMLLGRDEQVGLLVLQDGRWRWAPGIDARQLSGTLSTLEQLLVEGHASREAIDAQRDRLVEVLHWHALWQGTPGSLAIMVDSQFASLPWALLPAPDGSARPLLETTQLVLLQSLQPRTFRPPRRLFTLGASQAGSARLAELKEIGEELHQVAGRWPTLSRVEHLAATRADLVEALRSPGALLHIGAHGRGDRGLQEDAGLWLVGQAGQAEFVSAMRLRRLQVWADTVVLSACEASSSLAGRSLGIGGVAGSLVDAGANAVVGTRWPVSDRVAASFSESFHRALAAAAGDHERALQQAVLELRAQPFARHPAHWAGWFLLRAGPREPATAAADPAPNAKPGLQLTH